MREPGRLSAAIEILEDFEARRVPLKTAIGDWARSARYAGAKDRAWVSGLCLDVLRRRNLLAWTMGEGDARRLALGALRFLWRTPVDDLRLIAAETPHGPGPLTDIEVKKLSDVSNMRMFDDTAPVLVSGTGEKEGASTADEIPSHILGDYPDWLKPHIQRVFGADSADIMAGFAVRADIDLRVNALKATPEKASIVLNKVKGEAIPFLKGAMRIAAAPASEKAPAVSVIPAFNKGWFEVQDVGSQTAAAAAGDIKGRQVLDYCAGGGGKTLALAAMMENTGQIYAYDRDPRRLKPLFHRAKRAGVRNLQIRSPAGEEGVDDLAHKMDVVFVDAPCTGAGTWRRHPDTKWRLTPQQLERRMAEQDQVLKEAALFVRPGGRMIYVTCSFLKEENEDRLDSFLKANSDFSFGRVLNDMESSGLLTVEGRETLSNCQTAEGGLRLTPEKLRADGFFIATLERTS